VCLPGIEEATEDPLLIPKDPNDDKNIILEIRSGSRWATKPRSLADELFRGYCLLCELLRGGKSK
jgi:protein subunit release factor A